jgi:hypothetical protein
MSAPANFRYRYRCRCCSMTCESTCPAMDMKCWCCGAAWAVALVTENGSRQESPIKLSTPVEPPPVNSLVFVKNRVDLEAVVDPYWFLCEVTTHLGFEATATGSHFYFKTALGTYRLSDIGEWWKPVPEIYTAFLASLNLSFDQFALCLFQGGRDRKDGKVGSEVFGWDSVHQAECRGVAQAALELFSKSWVDVDSKRRLAREALRQVRSNLASTSSAGSNSQPNSDEVALLGVWLETHFPKQGLRNSDPIYEAMELLLTMRHRLDMIALHAAHGLGDDSKKG